jgi:hypothetical protein
MIRRNRPDVRLILTGWMIEESLLKLQNRQNFHGFLWIRCAAYVVLRLEILYSWFTISKAAWRAFTRSLPDRHEHESREKAAAAPSVWRPNR